MKTTSSHKTESRRSKVLLAGLVILIAGVTVGLLWRRASPPDVGSDKKVLKQVDALFTAVRIKDLRLLDQCANQLSALKKVGQLPDEAAATLTQIVVTAHNGDWESATENLLWFIQGQSANRHIQGSLTRTKS